MKVNEEAKDRRGNNNSKKAKKKRQQLTRGREGDITREIDALFSLHVSLPSCAFLSFFPFSHSLLFLVTLCFMPYCFPLYSPWSMLGAHIRVVVIESCCGVCVLGRISPPKGGVDHTHA